MVMEKLYSTQYIQSHKYIIFFITIAYTVFGIAGSMLLFEQGHAIISLTFVSLILLDSLKDILKIDLPPRIQNERRLALREYKDTLVTFGCIFAGLIVPFSIFSMFLPEQATSYLFSNQYNLLQTTSAENIYLLGTITSIFLNNLVVFLVCFLAAFLFGIGAIFLFIVVWNASVVGVVFGIVAQHTANLHHSAAPLVLIILFGATLPHIVLEMSGYFLSGATGERIADAVFFEKKKYLEREIYISLTYFAAGVVLITLGAVAEKTIAPAILAFVL